MTRDLDKPMDYSKCNPTELRAISIALKNIESNGVYDSSFPFTSIMLEEMAKGLEELHSIEINELKALHDELVVINEYLLEMSPKPPIKMTNDGLISALLKRSVVISLVSTFSYIAGLIEMRIAELENGISTEGANEQIN